MERIIGNCENGLEKQRVIIRESILNMKRILITDSTFLMSTYLLIAANPNFELILRIDSIDDCKIIMSSYTNMESTRDTFLLQNGVAHLKTSVNDTILAYIGIYSEEVSFLNPASGGYVYPHFPLMVAPNEEYDLNVEVELRRPPVITTNSAGEIGSAFAELQFEILDPIESEYKQLIIANIISQGDIRNYPKFLDMNRDETNAAVAAFIKDNPNTYMTPFYYASQYNSFDEAEMEETFSKLSPELQSCGFGKYVKRKLDLGRKYRVGSDAPDFTRTSLDGDKISLSDYRGQYVLLDFWGSWCAPCRASHPQLIELYEEFAPKGLVFVGVAQEFGKDLEKMKKLWSDAVEEDGLKWVQVLENEDPKNSITRAYNVASLPSKILVSPEGKIIAKYVGNSDQLEDKLKEILK